MYKMRNHTTVFQSLKTAFRTVVREKLCQYTAEHCRDECGVWNNYRKPGSHNPSFVCEGACNSLEQFAVAIVQPCKGHEFMWRGWSGHLILRI